MDQKRPESRDPESGYALLTVMVIVLVVTIAGAAFFAMSSYETRAALYRQASSEAFYLADGALERARAKFLEDRSWRVGWTGKSAGRGTYDLTVTDTTIAGAAAVRILATGHVEQADRRIDVLAELPPSAFGVALLILGDADVKGNMCLDGEAHVVGDGDFGPNDAHLACGGTHTDGFDITPPYMYTDPGHFPDATYYTVRGNEIGGTYQARIFNGEGVDITTALGDSLTSVTSYHNGSKTFTYTFDTHAEIQQYFDDVTGVFRRSAGDVGVVVNFGETAFVDPPGVLATSALEFDGSGGTTVNATIINTRFTGATEAQRSDTQYWTGGLTTLKQIIFEPYYGLTLVVYDFQKVGGSNSQIGTETWPAWLFVTRDVVDVNSNMTVVGAITCLGDWNSTGGPDIIFDQGFLDNLPGYFYDEWTNGVSGTLHVLRWREVPSFGG